MKKNTHPELREVIFRDVSIYKPNSSPNELGEGEFLIWSPIKAKETISFGDKVYPLVKVEVTSESHPFYTGEKKIVDTAGQVEKFQRKFGKFSREKSAAE